MQVDPGPSSDEYALPIDGIGISASFLTVLLLVIAFEFLLTSTVFGRQIVAVGSNESAAEVSELICGASDARYWSYRAHSPDWVGS